MLLEPGVKRTRLVSQLHVPGAEERDTEALYAAVE